MAYGYGQAPITYDDYGNVVEDGQSRSRANLATLAGSPGIQDIYAPGSFEDIAPVGLGGVRGSATTYGGQAQRDAIRDSASLAALQARQALIDQQAQMTPFSEGLRGTIARNQLIDKTAQTLTSGGVAQARANATIPPDVLPGQNAYEIAPSSLQAPGGPEDINIRPTVAKTAQDLANQAALTTRLADPYGRGITAAAKIAGGIGKATPVPFGDKATGQKLYTDIGQKLYDADASLADAVQKAKENPDDAAKQADVDLIRGRRDDLLAQKLDIKARLGTFDDKKTDALPPGITPERHAAAIDVLVKAGHSKEWAKDYLAKAAAAANR